MGLCYERTVRSTGKYRIMKNVAIITLTRVYNFGNSLQNYAVQRVLNELGYNAETIIYDSNTLKQKIKRKVKRLLRPNQLSVKKETCFDRFEHDHLRISKFKNLCTHNDQAEERYYRYIVGSDQVWNPSWYNDTQKKAYLLTFTDKNKKIAFSASFGLQELPNDWKEWFKRGLSDFSEISVREDAGVRIIKHLIGKDIESIIDPTLLLNLNDWRKIEKKPESFIEKRYILKYFLSPPTEKANLVLDNVPLEVIDLMSLGVGPSEFLWLFDHADLILTDSFHACVFSFLFSKPFIVYDRNWDGCNMNSRLETLLSIFHLERKYAGSDLPNDIWEHDYTEGYRQLEIERKKAIDFLRNALED